jgi:hypothetical protein
MLSAYVPAGMGYACGKVSSKSTVVVLESSLHVTSTIDVGRPESSAGGWTKPVQSSASLPDAVIAPVIVQVPSPVGLPPLPVDEGAVAVEVEDDDEAGLGDGELSSFPHAQKNGADETPSAIKATGRKSFMTAP